MKKRKEEEKDHERADRLSSLPEAILIHIFSFLDTKQAVQASFSLKKWVNLWTLIPDLEFDSSAFRKLLSFDRFVYKVLAFRDDSVKINRFTFIRKGRIRGKLLVRVTEYAASHHVQHLTMNTFFFNYIFEGHFSIRSLKLLDIPFRYWLWLEHLVTLHLDGVKLTGPGDFSNYPNLQNLTLKDCATGDFSGLVKPIIVAPQLSRLVIFNCFKPDTPPGLILFTPRLAFFKIEDSLLPLLLTDEQLTFLHTVDMNVSLSFTLTYDISRQLVSKLISMLKFSINVNSIRLSWFIIELLSMFPDILASEPSPFCNLKSLNIVTSECHKTTSVTIPGHVMTYLIGKSPDANIEIELPRCT